MSTLRHPLQMSSRRAGTSLTEVMVVMFIGTVVTSSIGFGTVHQLEQLRETHAVAATVASIRQCRMEAITRNAHIAWWIEQGYFVWWHDADEDGIEDSGEIVSARLAEEAEYATYPSRGTFDGRGTLQADYHSFPGMVVWIYFDTRTEVVTVSSNGNTRSLYSSS